MGDRSGNQVKDGKETIGECWDKLERLGDIPWMGYIHFRYRYMSYDREEVAFSHDTPNLLGSNGTITFIQHFYICNSFKLIAYRW